MEDAIKAIGLGTWRLRGRMGEPFEVLAAHMEGAWRHYFTMELKLHPLPEVGCAFQDARMTQVFAPTCRSAVV